MMTRMQTKIKMASSAAFRFNLMFSISWWRLKSFPADSFLTVSVSLLFSPSFYKCFGSRSLRSSFKAEFFAPYLKPFRFWSCSFLGLHMTSKYYEGSKYAGFFLKSFFITWISCFFLGITAIPRPFWRGFSCFFGRKLSWTRLMFYAS